MKCCVLCNSSSFKERLSEQNKSYFECLICGLIALDPAHRLSAEAEHNRYKLHNNSPADLRYRRFLNKAVQPLTQKLKPGMRGLDYGSGPGPTISVMLAESGYEVKNYDPFFSPLEFTEGEQFDFITCTETIEHFYKPDREFKQINQLLKTNGWLVLMTEVFYQGMNFESWSYLCDPTHVVFYQPETFIWLARKYNWEMLIPHKNVRLFAKQL